MNKYYIGFDAGTQSVKVAIYSLEMECVAEKSYPTTLNYPQSGWVEMDVNEYLEACKKGIRDCVTQMKEKGLNPNEVRGIFGDGIICGIAGIDENGKPITPYVNYLDSRCQKDVEELSSKNFEIWAKETGNPTPNCMFPAIIARWFLKNTRFLENGCKFVHNAPYILMNLAGLSPKDAFIDWGTMSGWGLGYNVYKKEWSDEQLKILNIDKKYLPKIVKPWDIIGNLSQEMAEFTGLPAGIPICAGAGDTMQSMLECGLLEKNMAADVAGTCAMFCVSTDGIKEELSKPENGLIFNSGTLENSYFYWGFIRTGGLALRWFRDNICDKVGEDSYFDKLSEAAEKIPTGANGVLFLPYLTKGVGELANASGCFLNMGMDTDQATLWRAVLEAIGYDYIGITDIYKKGGVSLEEITITEGGSKSNLWNQIKADMLNTKTKTFKKSGGAVMMNVLTVAYALGDIKDLKEIIKNNLEINKNYLPQKEKTDYYRKIFETRKMLLNSEMKEVFKILEKVK